MVGKAVVGGRYTLQRGLYATIREGHTASKKNSIPAGTPVTAIKVTGATVSLEIQQGDYAGWSFDIAPREVPHYLNNG